MDGRYCWSVVINRAVRMTVFLQWRQKVDNCSYITWKEIGVPFTTPSHPFLEQGVIIMSLGIFSPWGNEQLRSLSRNVLTGVSSPEIFHAARRGVISGLVTLCVGWIRSGVLGSSRGSCIRRSRRAWYHGWLGHTGGMSTIWAFWEHTWAITLLLKFQWGLAYP